MTKREMTKQRILEHSARFPKMQPADLFKYLYQSAFGCEHLVASGENAVSYIKREYEALERTAPSSVESLDGPYARVPLSILKEGLKPETLGALFRRSAKKEPCGKESLLEKLEIAAELAEEGKLPFSATDFASALEAWRDEGYPAVHHSKDFREAYQPSYRVIAKEYALFLPLFLSIDRLMAQKGSLTLAIEGGSASGKTTLAALLKEIYGCTVFHADDYFLRPAQRTSARLAEVGGNFDRERFLTEVLEPLHEGRSITYRRFDCQTQKLLPPVEVTPTPLTVVEGAYSMHPTLASYYDLSAFLKIDEDYQRERIFRRNTPFLAKRFFEEWIPMEKRYFEGTKITSRCDLVISITSKTLF